MKNVINFIKSELEGWKKFELITLSAILLFIVVNAFLVKDYYIAVISAICGITYTIFAGKGKISCFIFGLLGSFCYAFISFKNGVFGNLLLYLCYYIPMQTLGIFQWKKNLKNSAPEIIKTKLSKKEFIIISFFTIIATTLTILSLYHFKASSPVLDGITTIFSIVGMYLTVKRCIEQWLVWIVVNFLSTIMWLNLVLHGTQAYSTVIMWCVYFIAAIYFYFEWRKEVK